MKGTYIMFAIILLLGINLVNAETTRIEASEAIEKAEDGIKEMIESEFGTAFVNDTLIEAKKALNATNYDMALDKTQLIFQTKLRAYNVSDSIRALQLGVEEVEKLNLNSSRASELLDKTIVAFKNERYEEAENLISQTYTELGNVRAEATLIKTMIRATREDIVSFVKENLQKIVVASVVLIFVGYVIFNRFRIVRTKDRIKTLEIEREVLTSLMKKAQTDFFQKRLISREAYEIKMRKYKERMLEIKEMLPVLRARVESKKL